MSTPGVYLVINPELGWDNVCRAYTDDTITIEELLVKYPEDEYIIVEKTLHTSIKD